MKDKMEIITKLWLIKEREDERERIVEEIVRFLKFNNVDDLDEIKLTIGFKKKNPYG